MNRLYFVVLDTSGRAYPAVEYRADVICADSGAGGITPNRRFVKLLGPGEQLRDAGDGTFEGATDGCTYFRSPAVQ